MAFLVGYKESILKGFIWIACFVLCTFGYWCYGRTLISWWHPVAFAAAVATVSVMPLLRGRRHREEAGGVGEVLPADRNGQLNGRKKPLSGRTEHVVYRFVIVFSLAYGVPLGANYFLADDRSEHREEAVVERKLRNERTKYVQSGRRRRVASGKYYTYSLDLAFSDGSRKVVDVPLSVYNKCRNGGSRVFTMRRGLLGYPVISDIR